MPDRRCNALSGIDRSYLLSRPMMHLFKPWTYERNLAVSFYLINMNPHDSPNLSLNLAPTFPRCPRTKFSDRREWISTGSSILVQHIFTRENIWIGRAIHGSVSVISDILPVVDPPQCSTEKQVFLKLRCRWLV